MNLQLTNENSFRVYFTREMEQVEGKKCSTNDLPPKGNRFQLNPDRP